MKKLYGAISLVFLLSTLVALIPIPQNMTQSVFRFGIPFAFLEIHMDSKTTFSTGLNLLALLASICFGYILCCLIERFYRWYKKVRSEKAGA